MVDDIRNNLNQATEKLIQSFAPYDKKRVTKFKAGLHYLKKIADGEEKLDLYSITNDELLNQLLNKYNVPSDELDHNTKVLSDFEDGKIDAAEAIRQLPEILHDAVQAVNDKNEELYNMPAPAMIALSLDLVKKDVKDALIAGRTAERILQAASHINDKRTSAFEKEALLKDSLYDFGSEKELARPYIGQIENEPDYLVSAKATQHLAELLNVAISLNPDFSKDQNVKNTVNLFKGSSWYILNAASNKLKKSGAIEAAEKIGLVAKHLSDEDIKVYTKTKEHIDLLKDSFNEVNKKLREAGKLSQKESEDFQKLVDIRIDQI